MKTGRRQVLEPCRQTGGASSAWSCARTPMRKSTGEDPHRKVVIILKNRAQCLWAEWAVRQWPALHY
jgi:hypothetical protein